MGDSGEREEEIHSGGVFPVGRSSSPSHRRALDSQQRSNKAAPSLGGFGSFRARARTGDNDRAEQRERVGQESEEERRRRKKRKREKEALRRQEDERRRRRRRRGRELEGEKSARRVKVEVPRVQLEEEAFETKKAVTTAIVPKKEDFLRLRPAVCFFIDTFPDANNIAFGSLYAKHIPYFRRERAPLDRAHTRRQRGQSVVGQAPTSLQGAISSRFFGRGGRKVASTTARFRRSARERKRSPRDVSDFIPVQRDSNSSDEDEDKLEVQTRKRIAQLNAHIRSSPQNTEHWLALANYQDELVTMGMLDSTIATEKKVSVLARALASIPEKSAGSSGQRDLLRSYLQLVSERWSAADADGAYEKASTMYPSFGFVWVERLRHMLSSLSLFNIDLARTIYSRGIERLASYSSALPQQLELAIGAARLEFAAGYSERAIGILQALMDFNLGTPAVSGPALSEGAKVTLFQAYWRSGAARLGEEGGKGWGAWAVETRRRLSGYAPSGIQDERPPPPPPPPSMSEKPPPPPPVAGPSRSSPPSQSPPSTPEGAVGDRREDEGDLNRSDSSGGEWSSDENEEWSNSSEEEDIDDEVEREVTAAYRDEEADAAEVLHRWYRREKALENEQWYPARTPAQAGLGTGQMPIADAVRAAERIVGFLDISPVAFVPAQAPADIVQMTAELLGMTTDWWPWRWGENGVTEGDIFPELSGWAEHPAVRLAKRLVALPRERDSRENADSTEAFAVALGYLQDTGNVDVLRHLSSDRIVFAIRVLEGTVGKAPKHVAPILVTLIGVTKGSSSAKAVARQLLQENPEELDIYFALARAYERDGRSKDAVNIHRKMLKAGETPSSSALCGIVRMLGIAKKDGDGIVEVGFEPEKLSAVILGKEDTGDSVNVAAPTDMLRVRRILRACSEQAPEDKCFEAYLARALFDLFTSGVRATEQAMELERSQSSPSKRRTRSIFWALTCAAYLSHHTNTDRAMETEAFAVLKNALQSGLHLFPDDAWLLGVQAAVAVVSPAEDLNRFSYKLTSIAQDAIGPFVAAAFIWKERNQLNRAQGMLERCVSRFGVKSGWAWRELVTVTPAGDRRRREFLRGVAKCAWCRDFWVESLHEMGREISRVEAIDIASIIDEKGIYLRDSLQDALKIRPVADV